MRRGARALPAWVAASILVGLAASAPAAAKLVPDDIAACKFSGSVWADIGDPSGYASVTGPATCRLTEKDGSPSDGTYEGTFSASGEFIGSRIWLMGSDAPMGCIHGSLDGQFSLGLRDGSGSTVEYHSGAIHIQLGYGASVNTVVLGWADTTSTPGYIQQTNVSDSDGHWGGSGEGLVQLVGYCSDALEGTFILHI